MKRDTPKNKATHHSNNRMAIASGCVTSTLSTSFPRINPSGLSNGVSLKHSGNNAAIDEKRHAFARRSAR